jgi:hypothetical protein
MALSPVFTDTFTASNNTELATYDSGWTVAVSTGAGPSAPFISNNQLVCSGGIKAYRNTGTYSNDQYAQAVVKGSWDSSQYPGLSVRASGDDSTYTAYSFSGNSTTYYISKNVNSESGSDLTSGSWSPSVGDEIRLEVTGSSPAVIALYLNDSLVDDYSDASSPIASGRPGIAAYSQGAPSSDIDDFEAGDITGGGSIVPQAMANYRMRAA